MQITTTPLPTMIFQLHHTQHINCRAFVSINCPQFMQYVCAYMSAALTGQLLIENYRNECNQLVAFSAKFEAYH
jgi:hypothetical protein